MIKDGILPFCFNFLCPFWYKMVNIPTYTDFKGMLLGNFSNQMLSETINFDWKSDYKSDYYFKAVIELNWIYQCIFD